MSIIKELEIDQVEIVGPYKMIHVREATVIKEDGAELTRSFHRRVITPSCNISSEDAETQAICSAVHSPAIKSAYSAFLAAQ